MSPLLEPRARRREARISALSLHVTQLLSTPAGCDRIPRFFFVFLVMMMNGLLRFWLFDPRLAWNTSKERIAMATLITEGVVMMVCRRAIECNQALDALNTSCYIIYVTVVKIGGVCVCFFF